MNTAITLDAEPNDTTGEIKATNPTQKDTFRSESEPVFNRKRKGDASSEWQLFCVLCAARNAAYVKARKASRNKRKARG